MELSAEWPPEELPRPSPELSFTVGSVAAGSLARLLCGLSCALMANMQPGLETLALLPQHVVYPHQCPKEVACKFVADLPTDSDLNSDPFAAILNLASRFPSFLPSVGSFIESWSLNVCLLGHSG